MCSRYDLNALPRDLARRFGLTDVPAVPGATERRPTDRALVLGPGPRAMLLRWGIPTLRNGRPLINARAETLRVRPTFRSLLESRCLVPATAYFEWRRDGRTRFKNRVATADGEPFAFAGLVDGDFFAIITCEPAPAVQHIKDRMPVILERSREAAWLNPALRFDAVEPLLRPEAAPPIEAVEETPGDFQPRLL